MRWYLIFCVAVFIASFVMAGLLFAQAAMHGGKVLLDVNSVNEMIPEAIMLLGSIPGIFSLTKKMIQEVTV